MDPKSRLGYYLILALAIIPVIMWALMRPISARFADFSTTMTSLGQITALAGTVIFSITFILSTRAKWLEPLFGGINRAYIAHHIFGSFAFIFLLFHPLFLAASYTVFSFSAALELLLPGTVLAWNFGIAALLSMMLFLVFTFFIKLEYNRWKLTHQFLGFSLFMAALHVFFISSDISSNAILRYYMYAFIILGIIAFSYRTLFGRWLVKRVEYIVADIKPLDEKITEVVLDPKYPNQKLKYLSGQFAFIRVFGSPIKKEEHPFSIVSSPDEQQLRFNIKSLGDYTQSVKNITKGSTVLVEGPFGTFCSTLYSDKQVWISGGIGVTPFLSMLRTNPNKKIDFYYCVNDEKEGIYLDELEKASSKNPNIVIHPFFSKSQGIITADYIEKNSMIKDSDIFICGPPPMMAALKKQFIAKNIKKYRIITEEFGFK